MDAICRPVDSRSYIPVAGSYYNRNLFFRPRFEPSPTAATVDGTCFSLDFLPGNDASYWRIDDSCGSLLLLHRDDSKDGSRDMIVCEPLTRRYVIIPPMTASAGYLGSEEFLQDADDADSCEVEGATTGISNFRLFCCFHDHDNHLIHAGVFTSASGSPWLTTSIDAAEMQCIGDVKGRQYWINRDKKGVILDKSTLTFSPFTLTDNEDWLPHKNLMRLTLTTGCDGEARVVVGGGAAGSNLKVFARRLQGDGDEDEAWALERSIELSAATFGLPQLVRYYLISWVEPAEEPAGTVQVMVPTSGTMVRFRLNMETMEAERLSEVGQVANRAFPCEFPWPPSLVASCTDHAVE